MWCKYEFCRDRRPRRSAFAPYLTRCKICIVYDTSRRNRSWITDRRGPRSLRVGRGWSRRRVWVGDCGRFVNRPYPVWCLPFVNRGRPLGDTSSTAGRSPFPLGEGIGCFLCRICRIYRLWIALSLSRLWRQLPPGGSQGRTRLIARVFVRFFPC